MLLLSTSRGTKESMRAAKPYHHGDLREALMRAAEALIGEVGPRAFTLREVARRAGVSHNAPYRHFESRDDLLLAVAAEGFERLRSSMARRMERGGSAREKLEQCGCGYVEFALRWPQHFTVMFDLAGLLGDARQGAPIGESAFQVLLDSITAAQQAGILPKTDPLPLAWTAWSLVHGIAKLAIGGNLPLNQRATLDFTRRAAGSLVLGLEQPR
jgi:AcrR family transcriptional regulator